MYKYVWMTCINNLDCNSRLTEGNSYLVGESDDSSKYHVLKDDKGEYNCYYKVRFAVPKKPWYKRITWYSRYANPLHFVLSVIYLMTFASMFATTLVLPTTANVLCTIWIAFLIVAKSYQDYIRSFK